MTKHAPIEPLSASDHNEAPRPLVGADATKRATIGLDHLTHEQLDELGDRLDVVRQRILDDIGQKDADYIRRVDVPKSEFAFDLDGRQIRYLTVLPKERKAMQKISLIKGRDQSAPVVMAITLQTE